MFDLLKMFFMGVAILLGTFLGGFVSGMFGTLTGGLFGAIIVGMIVYYIYSLLSGQKTFLMGAIVFGVLNYASVWITGYIGSMTGFIGGIASLVIQVIILSLAWGWVGGKAQPSGTVQTGLKP